MREYATSDSGVRFLRYIHCDGANCSEKVVPGPSVAGWIKTGQSYGPGGGDNQEWEYCPDCATRLSLVI